MHSGMQTYRLYAIIKILDDPSPLLCANTARLLVSVGDPATIDSLSKLLNDNDNEVRLQIVETQKN